MLEPLREQEAVLEVVAVVVVALERAVLAVLVLLAKEIVAVAAAVTAVAVVVARAVPEATATLVQPGQDRLGMELHTPPVVLGELTATPIPARVARQIAVTVAGAVTVRTVRRGRDLEEQEARVL